MKVKLSDGTFAECEAVKTMVLTPDRISGGRETAEMELDRKVRLLARETGRSYGAAMATVLGLDAELKARWVRETLRPVRK